MRKNLNTAYMRKQTFYLSIVALALLTAACSERPETPVAARVVMVQLKKGEISPHEIRVKQGEKVKLQAATLDVQHSIEVPELKISEPVNPGMPAEIVVDTSRKGAFQVECGIRCGAKHDDMKATIVVE